MPKKIMSFKEAAYRILKVAKEPMPASEIYEKAFESGLIKTEGKTPEATMAAIIYVDLNKNPATKFKKAGRGKFTLKEQKDSTTTPLLLIENQNELVKKALMNKLQDMDPYQFEILVADLLNNIGYENVEVTKRSGDKGIDVIAHLTMDGITNVKTIIQAKKYAIGNNVPGRVVRELRGSAEVDQRGLVITTSDYQKDAIEESKAPNKMPVALINGDKLINLLIKHNVGVKVETVSLFSIDNEYFENEEVSDTLTIPNQKHRGLWPLPGGINSYVDTLFKFLTAVSDGTNTKIKLISWYKTNFDSVNSEKTITGYLQVPKLMGLITVSDNTYTLTTEGKQILESKDHEYLYDVISKNIFAFEDVYEFIKTSKEPQTEQTILNFLKANFDVDWSTFAQVTFRLHWLVNLGKLKRTEEGYTLP